MQYVDKDSNVAGNPLGIRAHAIGASAFLMFICPFLVPGFLLVLGFLPVPGFLLVLGFLLSPGIYRFLASYWFLAFLACLLMGHPGFSGSVHLFCRVLWYCW